MSESANIIEKIKTLIKQKGYIYSFCQILINDFILELDKLHEIDHSELVSINEASLIIGFLIQSRFDLKLPESPERFLQMKQETYILLKELHYSFNDVFIEELKKNYLKQTENSITEEDKKNFWLKDNMWIEPFFYSDTGIYDFQYLEYLDKKYKYDFDWLIKNKNFDIYKIKNIVQKLKDLIINKEQKNPLVDFNFYVRKLIETTFFDKKIPTSDYYKIKNEIEYTQYNKLFENNSFKKYCVSLLSLFLFKKSDLNIEDLEYFLENFSFKTGPEINSQFLKIGDYNIINSRPIIKLNNNVYFLPITFPLFKAVYENPFYWMLEDKKYKDIALYNRGKVGEEMFYENLKTVFKDKRTYKSVKIKSNKSKTITDIDVLCVLRNKALCVQVKSKKLTLLSQQGSILQLQKDFREAIQEAYEQGLVCREQINLKNSMFIDENGNSINLPEEVDDCFIMCGTTEVSHALVFQLEEMLHKKANDPFPIALSIFDLELISHYLNDPYDFLYYIRQRTTLADYYKAMSEMDLLGYHLTNKMFKQKNTIINVDSSFAQMIDRNYYPFKIGLKIPDKGDALKKRWYNKEFESLCNELKNMRIPQVTDILFLLLDLSSESKERLISFILKYKQKTLNDYKNHTFSFAPGQDDVPGISYYSINNDDLSELNNRLTIYCLMKKYSCKANSWIGFGCIKNSKNIIDMVYFDNHVWQYDSELETESKKLLTGKGQLIRANKIGRNELCPCGSMRKYKHCCGKNQ